MNLNKGLVEDINFPNWLYFVDLSLHDYFKLEHNLYAHHIYPLECIPLVFQGEALVRNRSRAWLNI